MSKIAGRLSQLRTASAGEAARLVFRKTVYRKVRMGRYGYFAREAVRPHRPLDLRIALWGPERFDAVHGTNEHLTADDLEHFRRQRTCCIVVLDGERIAASSWMTGGLVYVHELDQVIEVPEGEHFSCRSFVDPDYRGLSLFSHMVYAYTKTLDPDVEVWGFVYYWNTASIRSLANIGWRYSGDYWTTYALWKKLPGSSRCEPRSAFEGQDVYIP